MDNRYGHFITKMRALAMGLGVAFAAFSNHTAFAAESVLLPNPTGGTDINQATLPPTGLYGFVAGLPYNASTSYNDQFGNTSKAQQFNNPTILGGLLFVYPWQVLGGQVASSIILQEHSSCLTLNQTIHSCSPGGIGDTYSDFVYWTKNVGLFGVTPGDNPYLKYGLNIGGGLAAKIPTGPYSATEPPGVAAGGNNLFVWVPDVAFTYNTGPNWSFFESTQISARFYYAIPNINPATNYQSGQVLDIDFAVTQLWGHTRFGVAGSYVNQLTDDFKNGVVVPAFTSASFGSFGIGKKFESLFVGPFFSYTWDNGIQFKAKYAQIVLNRATVNENVFVFSVGAALWQPDKPLPKITK